MSADAEASDADLARRISGPGRAPQAEAELCARFAPRIRSYGLRHLAQSGDADDLVQRVLVLVLTKLRAGAVREPDQIASFVLGSARLTASSMRRDASRSGLSSSSDPDSIEPAVPPREPIDGQRLARCLTELPERERSVVLRSFFEGASATEIAKPLGIEAGHVRVIRHRALARLRACLDPDAADNP